MSVTFQLEDFHRIDVSPLYLEAQGGPDDMESLNARSSGIDHQHIAAGIPHDFQNMGMAAHEDVRLILVYQRFGTDVIPPGISADMGHQDLHALTFEEAVERVFEAQVMVVAVSCDSHKRFEPRYLGGHFHAAAEIPRMPDLVDRLQEFPDAGVENAVGVGYESYIHMLEFDEDILLIKNDCDDQMDRHIQQSKDQGHDLIHAEDCGIVP